MPAAPVARRCCSSQPTPALPIYSHTHTHAAHGSSSRRRQVESSVGPFSLLVTRRLAGCVGGSGMGGLQQQRAGCSLSQALRWPNNEKTNGGTNQTNGDGPKKKRKKTDFGLSNRHNNKQKNNTLNHILKDPTINFALHAFPTSSRNSWTQKEGLKIDLEKGSNSETLDFGGPKATP